MVTVVERIAYSPYLIATKVVAWGKNEHPDARLSVAHKYPEQVV